MDGFNASLHTASVAGEQAGTRLDKWLAAALPEWSRTRLKSMIESGQVSTQGIPVRDPAFKVRAGQVFAFEVPPATPATPAPQPIALEVVYEDEDLIVVEKPAGMVVHPAPGSPDTTLVNALLAHCGGSLSGIGGVKRPGIVHRLDKDTSGLIVAAKNDVSHRSLSQQFATRRVERGYVAVTWGVPMPPTGSIEGNIGRSPVNRKKMAVVSQGGKPALTRYVVRRAFRDVAALLECRLATGRTHQIRVHLAAAGHPLIGDPLYGRVTLSRKRAVRPDLRDRICAFPRQALHAFSIGFMHPRTNVWHSYESPIPRDINLLVRSLEAL